MEVADLQAFVRAGFSDLDLELSAKEQKLQQAEARLAEMARLNTEREVKIAGLQASKKYWCTEWYSLHARFTRLGSECLKLKSASLRADEKAKLEAEQKERKSAGLELKFASLQAELEKAKFEAEQKLQQAESELEECESELGECELELGQTELKLERCEVELGVQKQFKNPKEAGTGADRA